MAIYKKNNNQGSSQFQYQKVKAPKNAYINDFYMIMFNQVALGAPIQDKKTVKAIFEWLDSIESDQCDRAHQRSK
jgi:hypothetical protein